MTGKKKKKIQKKNVSYLLADVRHPAKKASTAFSEQKGLSKKKFELTGVSKRRKRTGSLKFAAAMAVLVLISCGVAGWGVKDEAMGSIITAYKSFQSAADSAKRYDTSSMGNSLRKAESSLEEVEGYTSIFKLIPFLKEIPGFISSLRNFNNAAMNMADIVEDIKKEGFMLIWDDGEKLLANVENAKDRIKVMSDSLMDVRNRMAALGFISKIPKDYLSLQSKMSESVELLEGVGELLKGETNIVAFFMNDSEIRPTGGFIGSYAVIKIVEGEIEDIAVNDIYYPDKFLETKTVPPIPLQAITTDWEARDANWFFNFPTSVSKIIGFLESSPVYADKKVKFDGAIAINHKVVTDVLKLTGPIELPGYGVVLDSSNFLAEVQKEVSRDSTERGGERKNILKSLLPEMISRMKTMTAGDKTELLRALSSRLDNKDVQVYFNDQRIQSFASKSMWSGEVYDIPDSEYGDYLAVVASNIAGEKTDAYIRQKIELRSLISEAGGILNTVSVIRVHEGDDASEAFYQADNQAYIRALVPNKAKLISISGATKKNITSLKEYDGEEYIKDPDVELFDSGMESGKAVFGDWLKVSAGKEKEMSIQYERPAAFSDKFRFVYEKQSGINSMFSYSVQAPSGYIFKETGTSVFEYENIDPPSRLIIDLTLERI